MKDFFLLTANRWTLYIRHQPIRMSHAALLLRLLIVIDVELKSIFRNLVCFAIIEQVESNFELRLKHQ